MPHIDYFFTTLSPWSYLAGLRMEASAARHGATITYRPMDIAQVFARTGGKPLGERPQARKDYRLQELPRWAEYLGMPLNVHPAHWPTNGAPSAYAIIAAQAAGGGNIGGLVHGVLRATWAEQRDIADDAVIRDLLEQHGFDPKLADTGLFTGAETYGRNTEDAVAAGVFGSPFYITDDGAKFWGQDRLDFLDRHLGNKRA